VSFVNCIANALGLSPIPEPILLDSDYTHTSEFIAPFKGQKHSEETKEQIRKSKSGTKHRPETIAKMKESRQNISTETRAKMSATRKGKPIHTEESRAKMSIAQKGRPLSEKHKAALRVPKRKLKKPS